MRQAANDWRSAKADSGGCGGEPWRLAVPGSHPWGTRGGVLLRRRAGRRPVGADRLALCRQVSIQLCIID